jgi:hypothetical protein
MRCTQDAQNYDTLAGLVEKYLPELAPEPDELVVHLRVGDVIEDSPYSVSDLLSKQRKFEKNDRSAVFKAMNAVWRAKGRLTDYVKTLAYYKGVAKKYSNSPVTTVVLVAGGCYVQTFPKSAEYIKQVKQMFVRAGFDVKLRVGNPPDDGQYRATILS